MLAACAVELFIVTVTLRFGTVLATREGKHYSLGGSNTILTLHLVEVLVTYKDLLGPFTKGFSYNEEER